MTFPDVRSRRILTPAPILASRYRCLTHRHANSLDHRDKGSFFDADSHQERIIARFACHVNLTAPAEAHLDLAGLELPSKLPRRGVVGDPS